LCEEVVNIVQAIKTLKYGSNESKYRVPDLTPAQQRLIDGVIGYGMRLIEGIGRSDLAEKISKYLALTRV